MTPINDLTNGFFNWGDFTPFFVAVSVPSTDPNSNPDLDGFPQSATTPHRHVKQGENDAVFSRVLQQRPRKEKLFDLICFWFIQVFTYKFHLGEMVPSQSQIFDVKIGMDQIPAVFL